MYMTHSEFFSEFENISLQPPGSIHGQEPLDSVKGWDSLAVVGLMSMVDEKLGIQLDPSRIMASRRVIDLAILCGIES
jgi:acyl carrier protein